MLRIGIAILFCACMALPAETAAGLKWTAPAGWISKGATAMRAATYDVNGSECVVYFFGSGQGGSVDANVARWTGQFTVNGKPAQPTLGKRTVHGLPITTVETTGVYAGMSGPAMSTDAPKPDYRMLAAIVEGPGGNIFIKFTGPAKAIAASRPQFDRLVASFQKE